jgi:uncharacterized membrane protein
MSLRIMMMINTVIAGIFGVGFVLIPWQVQVVYGIQPTPALNYVSELFGAALISLAVLSWSAKDLVESDVRRAIVRALFLGDAIGFVLALFGQLSAVLNNFGWSVVLIYLFLAVGFGSFHFRKPAEKKSEE